MPSVCLMTSIFTIESMEPTKNKYISIFILWLSSLIRTNSLNEDDLLMIIMDEKTKDYIITFTIFDKLCKTLNCDLNISIIPVPNTFQEGCLYRYYVNSHYTQDILMYTDVDIQFIKSLKNITNKMKENTIYLNAEGLLEHANYGSFITDEEKSILYSHIPSLPGFNSGKFAFYGKNFHKDIFSILWQNNNVYKDEKNVYCYDQCLFNKAIYNSCMVFGYKLDIAVFGETCTNFQGFQHMKDMETKVIIDCCGEPNNPDLHACKIQVVYLNQIHFG